MVAESDGERRPAGLTVSEGRRGGGDPASAHQHLPDLERAARRSRATRPAKDDGAVSPQNDAPAAPDAVLVDPELRLEPPSFRFAFNFQVVPAEHLPISSAPGCLAPNAGEPSVRRAPIPTRVQMNSVRMSSPFVRLRHDRTGGPESAGKRR